MGADDFRRGVQYADSYNRMDRLQEMFIAARLFDSSRDRLGWFTVLGEEWSGCDNIAAHRWWLSRVLLTAARCEFDAMMDEGERAEFDRLPDMLTVFRGCYAHNRLGLSWTLDRGVAERIVTLSRYRQPGTPLLLTGRVRKGRCALMNERQESEIVSASVRRIAEVPLPPP